MRALPKLLAAGSLLLVASCPGCPEQCQLESLFGIPEDEELAFCPDSYQLELRLMSGNSQSGFAGAVLDESIVFKVVTDYQNLPRVGIQGVEVEVAVTGGGGTVDGVTSKRYTTDFDGDVRVDWRTGPAAGPNEITATIVSTEVSSGRFGGEVPIIRTRGSPQNAIATGLPRPITGVSVHAGTDQVAAVGTPVPVPPAVRVSDVLGPAAGVPVTFTVDLGGGTVTGATVDTDANGVAAVGSWVLGTAAGANRLRADAGSHTALIMATGVAGTPVTMTKVAGDGQAVTSTGTGLITLPIAPRVRLADQYGNPVPGVSVSFGLGPGAGSVTNPAQDTDAAGEAAPSFWQVGSQPGQYTMIATASSAGATIVGSPATFTATVLPAHGPPTTMTAVAGGGQSVGVGQAVPVLPAVRVTDAQDRPVPGVTITFSPGTASGTITGATPATDANGVATLGGWTLGNTAGVQYVIVSAPAGSGIAPSNLAIQVTALPGAPLTLAKLAGDNQTAIAGSPVFTRPAVVVRDQHGNGVPGVPVTFAVTGGGGTVTGASQTTDASGRAFVGGWVLGDAPGPNTLTATVPPPTANTMTTSSVSFAAQGVIELRGVADPGRSRSP